MKEYICAIVTMTEPESTKTFKIPSTKPKIENPRPRRNSVISDDGIEMERIPLIHDGEDSGERENSRIAEEECVVGRSGKIGRTLSRRRDKYLPQCFRRGRSDGSTRDRSERSDRPWKRLSGVISSF